MINAAQLDNRNEIIKSTIPLLEEHGIALVEKMYAYLLENYPKYKRHFNQAHQKDGDGKQITVLKNYLVAYAKNIDNPSVLLPALEKAAQRHAGKLIMPEDYPPVGESILFAIKEQFNLPEGHEVLLAWADAYKFLADTMIDLEKLIYSASKKRVNGWESYRTLTVLEVSKETDDVKRLWIGDKHLGKVAKGSALQHITIYSPEINQSREYSLVSSRTDLYEIAVKRDGVFSTYLHEQATPGTDLLVSMPFGGVGEKLENLNSNVLVFSGGVGITAHIDLLNLFNDKLSDRQAFHFHSVKNKENHCFRYDLKDFNSALNIHCINVYSEPGEGDRCGEDYDFDGYLNAKIITAACSDLDDASCFVCGPYAYMRSVKDVLLSLGVSLENIHFEYFGPSIEIN